LQSNNFNDLKSKISETNTGVFGTSIAPTDISSKNYFSLKDKGSGLSLNRLIARAELDQRISESKHATRNNNPHSNNDVSEPSC
jgi:hypothetical protein